jgi:hypothetical protein
VSAIYLIRTRNQVLGWEVKACGSGRVTLLTPEPDSGFYGEQGVTAFLRRYGRAVANDTIYFTGTHHVGVTCKTTGQHLAIDGFDERSGKIVKPGGGLHLVASDGTIAASWSFRRLLEHWARKHASAVYVPYSSRNDRKEYRFESPVRMGEGTDFARFLAALASGKVCYDPAPKLERASTPRPRCKARSQFRIKPADLKELYASFEEVHL